MRPFAALLLFLTASLAPAAPLAEAEKAEGFVALFDGATLDGWQVIDGKPEVWGVEDGILVCRDKGGGWLGTRREYDNFILRLDYRFVPGGNSGVYLRAPEKGWISRLGMEIQLLDDNAPQYNRLDFHQYTGSIYHVVAPTQRAGKPGKARDGKPDGEWNQMEIHALGRQVVVVLNGKKIVDADLDRALRDEAVAKEHPGLKRTTGRLGLQSHSERVEFRKVRVKEVKPGT